MSKSIKEKLRRRFLFDVRWISRDLVVDEDIPDLWLWSHKPEKAISENEALWAYTLAGHFRHVPSGFDLEKELGLSLSPGELYSVRAKAVVDRINLCNKGD